MHVCILASYLTVSVYWCAGELREGVGRDAAAARGARLGGAADALEHQVARHVLVRRVLLQAAVSLTLVCVWASERTCVLLLAMRCYVLPPVCVLLRAGAWKRSGIYKICTNPGAPQAEMLFFRLRGLLVANVEATLEVRSVQA